MLFKLKRKACDTRNLCIMWSKLGFNRIAGRLTKKQSICSIYQRPLKLKQALLYLPAYLGQLNTPTKIQCHAVQCTMCSMVRLLSQFEFGE